MMQISFPTPTKLEKKIFHRRLIMKDVPINATTSFAKAMLEDPNVKKEIQIIYNAKTNPYNPVAWQKVYETFLPLVRSAVRNSGVKKLNLTNEQFESEANDILKKAVMEYDINNIKGARPVTFLSGRLVGNLSKVKRSGRMISGTEKNESHKVLVNKIENILRSQNKPTDPKSIFNYLKKHGYDLTLSDVQRALAFNVRELSGSQLIGGGDDISGNGAITYQELVESKHSKTPAQMMDERNKMLHAYNSIHSFKDREFVKAVLWMQKDKLGLGVPTALMGVTPANFKELCGIYKIGSEKGKKIYLAFLRAAGDL